ncbi:hypothetical protein ENTCAN_08165 [Enterobacter cancerogenus ATCC 35316]|nr:hypothetical protein ENTCAN_08165 [Enterobacter cancerogenus ATCC 35316]
MRFSEENRLKPPLKPWISTTLHQPNPGLTAFNRIKTCAPD